MGTQAKPLQPLATAPTPAQMPPKPQDVAAAAQVAGAKAPDDKYKLRSFGRGTRLIGTDPATPNGREKLQAALDDYVIVEQLPQPARYNYKATCRECAWQTHVQSLAGAIESIKEHAQRHLFQV
jgi:hypothetical protein